VALQLGKAPSCLGLYIYGRLGSSQAASKAQATRVGKHYKLLRCVTVMALTA
jgi:hypothetical protein